MAIIHAHVIQVFLSLVLALSRLARAANRKAQEGKETVITPRHITAVAAVSLLSYMDAPVFSVNISTSCLCAGCIGQLERIEYKKGELFNPSDIFHTYTHTCILTHHFTIHLYYCNQDQ